MKWIFAAGVLLVLCSGCASVTQGSTHPLRIDTETAKGQTIDDADCSLTNDHGTTQAQSGQASPVRRSGQDLKVTCTSPGQPEASARLISRANAGLAGNIIIGGGIGALIDHSSGSAYTYPSWVRLVFGEMATFDRKDEVDGMAMSAVGASALAPAAQAGLPAQGGPVDTKAAAPTLPDSPAALVALRAGDTFDYAVTDRMTGAKRNVLMRADRVIGTQVSFNGGSRIEQQNGEVVGITAALLGEMDQVTPPGGWMSRGKLPRGSWVLKFKSIVPGSRMNYDLTANADRERPLRTAAGEFRAIRIDLQGWIRNDAARTPDTIRYEASVWLSPELRRVVRFEAKTRGVGPFGAHINEIAELTRAGRD